MYKHFSALCVIWVPDSILALHPFCTAMQQGPTALHKNGGADHDTNPQRKSGSDAVQGGSGRIASCLLAGKWLKQSKYVVFRSNVGR